MNTLENVPKTYQEHKELEQKILNSEGWKIRTSFAEIENSLYIFRGNYDELIKLFKKFHQPESLVLFEVRNKPDLDHFLLEFLRLFHNFVASAMSLVDHSRKSVRNLYKKGHVEFLEEHKKEIDKRFTSNPHLRFVQKLRNYFLHYDIPLVSATLNLKDIKQELLLDVNDLLKWNEWRDSKAFLKAQTENINIKIIVENYFNIVIQYYNWLYNKQQEIHKMAFDELDKLYQKHSNSRWTVKF